MARLFAYVGTLALLAILAIHAWDQWPRTVAGEVTSKPVWGVADRSPPAFAVGSLGSDAKSVIYTVLRHPRGGRKDIFRWSGQEGTPLAELEIYRLGSENDPASSVVSDLAARMPRTGGAGIEAVGVIDSKFGTVALLRRTSAGDGSGPCLAFLKRINDPALQISGWSCQGDSLPVRRVAIVCMLDSLTLLTSGNQPKMAELFAHADFKRGSCGESAASADWVTDAQDPKLRGTF